MRNQLFMIGLLATVTGACCAQAHHQYSNETTLYDDSIPTKNTTITTTTTMTTTTLTTTTEPKTDSIFEPYNIATTHPLLQLALLQAGTVTTSNTVISCISGLLISFTLSVLF